MSAKFESSLWKWVSAASDDLRNLHMERVENAVGSASPDVEGQFGDHGHFHLELKTLKDQTYANDPEKECGRLKFEIGQREWMQRRWEVGGIAYTLIEGFHSDLYLIPGAYLMALERIGTVKTVLLRDLSTWTVRRKSPEARTDLFYRLLYPEPQRHAVAERLQRDPQLRSACSRTGALASAIGSLPTA